MKKQKNEETGIMIVPTKRLRAGAKLLTLFAALGVGTWGVSVANANELVNGNLDATNTVPPSSNLTPTGWTIDAVRTLSGPHLDAAASESWCNVLEQPFGYGLFFKPFQGQAGGDEITIHFYQDVPASPGTKYTLSGYAAGESSYSGFFATNTPAPQTLFVVQFLNGASTVIASNGYDLITAGLPSGGPGSMQNFQFITPQLTAPAGTVTVRVGASIIDVYSTSGQQGFFVDAFELLAEAPPGAPVITNPPSHTTVSPGANATFTVGVSNTAGATYQWQFYGTNISNGGPYSGVTTPTLTVTGVSNNEVGHYRVRVTNAGGSATSAEATLAIVDIHFYPAITITGRIGDTYRVDYSTKVAPTTWIPLSTNMLTMSPQLVLDPTAAGDNTRFYRAVFLY